MNAAIPPGHHRRLVAYAGPMFLFILLLGLGSTLRTPAAPFWRASPEFWIFPLQTLSCAALLFYFRRDYPIGSVRRPLFTVTVALAVFLLWIAPQQFLHFPPRLVGFNPEALAGSRVWFWVTLILRFARLVVVVPLVEEIFWRGFLLRYLIAEQIETVAIGTFSWISFIVVSVAFCISHSRPDWPAALLTGAIYNLVAYRTKSLSSCILAHALTNLALGLWIISTRQWGFW
jgi:uncharacterized protein